MNFFDQSLRVCAVLKKRLIGVITVKNGWAVQSFGYQRYLPIGRPAVVAENLDRWGADEILILAIDRTLKRIGPDFELIETLGKLALSTPLTYGGGILNLDHASLVIKAGAERICIDSLLHGEYSTLCDIAKKIGSQAIIGSLPLSKKAGKLQLYNYISKQNSLLSPSLTKIFKNGLISEAIVIDWQHEGRENGFNLDLIRHFPIRNIPLIGFGGLNNIVKIKKALKMSQVVAIGIGNFLNYKEHSLQHYKNILANFKLRLPDFASDT